MNAALILGLSITCSLLLALQFFQLYPILYHRLKHKEWPPSYHALKLELATRNISQEVELLTLKAEIKHYKFIIQTQKQQIENQKLSLSEANTMLGEVLKRV